MLSLWLDSTSNSLAELIPAAYIKPLCPRVKVLIQTINTLQRTTPVERNDPALDEHTLQALFAAGLFSLTVPAELGGLEVSLRDFVPTMEAVGQLGAAWAMTAVPHLCISVKAVARYAEAERRTQILKEIQLRQQLLAFAITEDQGSDVAAIRTRLQKTATGEFVLNGRKQWITNLKRASHVVVACLCPDLHNAPGASVLVLVKLQQAGVTISRPWDKVCVNGSDTSDLFFDQVKISEQQILTKPGQGMNAFLEMVQPGRLGTAAASVGLARRALEQAKESLTSSNELNGEPNFYVDGIAQLNAISAGLRMCAVFADEKHYDFVHLVSLMKFISGELTQALIQKLDHTYALHKCDLPEVTSNNRDALVLFRLLKGPGEILAWQTVLAWSAVILKQIDEKSNWPGHLQDDARYLISKILVLRQHGGPNQHPSLVEQIARGLALWWLEMSCLFLSNDNGIELSSVEIEQAQTWSRLAFVAWREENENAKIALHAGDIDHLFTQLPAVQSRLFNLRLELCS